MTTTRTDPYLVIHKGLRRSLFETTLLVARCDFGGDDWRQAEAAVARMFAFLREHGELEDRFVQPLLARLDADVAARLDADHAALERAAIAVESLWPRVAAADAEARRVLGAELLRRLHALVAEQLTHMDREERDGNRVLWAHLADAEIDAIRVEAGKSIPAARQPEWAALVAPTLTASERARI